MKWMTYKAAHAFEPEARKLGVSKVARSPRGFMRAYERTARRHKTQKETELAMGKWISRRDAFLKRWIPLYHKKPSRKKALVLAMWAYRVPAL